LKIIFLVESKFCQRDYDRFGLETLSNRGYKNIEVWDFSCCFRPNYFKIYAPTDLLSGDGYISISNKSSAMQLLQATASDSVFVCLIGFNAKSAYIFKYLNQKQLVYGFMSVGHLPLKNRKSFRKIKRALRSPSNGLRYFFDWIKVKIYTLGSTINPNFLILGGGAASNRSVNIINGKTILLKAHTLDYDLFLTSKDLLGVEQERKYAVFLDHYLPHHPDLIDNKVVSEAYYYSTLNNFFDYIENALSLKVVIAPHPRADYTNGNPFNNRSIANQPTHLVVKNSELVMTHYSTSTSFAVLYNKPILFLNDGTYPVDIQGHIKDMASFFHKQPINILALNFKIQTDDLVVNNNIYNTYKELYIKEGNTPEKQIWDIFSDYLDKL
jgi:hypothetical protein